MDELKTKVLADREIKIVIPKNTRDDEISNADKLAAVSHFLDAIFAQLKEGIAPKIGSEFVSASFTKFFDSPKIKSIDKGKLKDGIANDNAWYVLDSFAGTDEELGLIDFIKSHMGNLEEHYKEIYLLRNEEVYKIFDFEKGRGFQPDFLLFLKTRKKHSVGVNDIELYYQIFIEPKGNEYIGADGTFTTGKEAWKEQFQDEIQKKYGFEKVIKAESRGYRLIALPFFNRDHNAPFQESFQEVVR